MTAHSPQPTRRWIGGELLAPAARKCLSIEGKLLGNPRGIGSLGFVGVLQGIVKAGTLTYRMVYFEGPRSIPEIR